MSPRGHDIEADAGSSHTALRGRYGWTVSETVSRVRLLDMLHRGKRIESAACPVSTGGGTRRVQSVREGGGGWGGGGGRGQTEQTRREALQKNRRGSAPPRVHMNRKMTAHRTGEPTTAQRRGRGATSAQACGPFLSRACPRRRDRGCTPTPPAAAPPQLSPLELHAQTGHRHPLPPTTFGPPPSPSLPY